MFEEHQKTGVEVMLWKRPEDLGGAGEREEKKTKNLTVRTSTWKHGKQESTSRQKHKPWVLAEHK